MVSAKIRSQVRPKGSSICRERGEGQGGDVRGGQEEEGRTNPRRGGDEALHWDVHHAVVDEAGGEGREPSHGTVHGVLCEEHAVEGVAGIGRHRSTERMKGGREGGGT
jgi:hypothetical protein